MNIGKIFKTLASAYMLYEANKDQIKPIVRSIKGKKKVPTPKA